MFNSKENYTKEVAEKLEKLKVPQRPTCLDKTDERYTLVIFSSALVSLISVHKKQEINELN